MMPKVSILVPIYNASKYIERCAHSLFQQTFEDIEYVFVNDCTPDDSIEKLQKVIEQYPNRKCNVKILSNLTNQHTPKTRNIAFENSTGEYILFIDNDDYIELNMVEVLYNKAKNTNADIVVCDIIYELKNKSSIVIDCVVDNREENIKSMIINKDSQGYVWNKLIKRKLFIKSEYKTCEALLHFDDWLMVCFLYYYADKIVKINQPFYHYELSNEKSFSKNKHQYFENTMVFFSLLEVFFKEKNTIEKYKNTIDNTKIKLKIILFFQTNTLFLRYEYRNMFIEEEKKLWHTLKMVEKVMLFCSKQKYLLWLTQIIKKLVLWKAKLFNKNS